MANLVTIKANQPSYSASDKPPSFQIYIDGYKYFGVQIATDNFLLNGASATRRTVDRFFDSWLGDDPSSLQAPRIRREVPPEKHEAKSGRATFTFPQIIWNRLNWSEKLYYRAIASNDLKRSKVIASVRDTDYRSSPFIMVAKLPSQRRRNAAARFIGKNALRRPDLFLVAKRLVAATAFGLVNGRDQDFFFVFLDADRFHMVVLECHDEGLTDTIDMMPRKPDAVINGQFISSVIGIGTEGETIREEMLINESSQKDRFYIGQEWGGQDVSSYHVGKGNPSSIANIRSAFGGLGPILLGAAPVLPLTPWAKSIYDKDRDIGRGAVAIHRGHRLILLIAQRNISWYSPAKNAMKMVDVRNWLSAQGVSDAIFNDGSDSESLYSGGWMLKPAFVKDEAMDFAISFVDRTINRRLNILAIDGTKTRDGEEFGKNLKRPFVSHYAPQNISSTLNRLGSLAPVLHTFRNEIIEAWRCNNQNEANIIGQIFSNAGSQGYYTDILYISSHASRHGQLWMHQGDIASNPKLTISDPWSTGFRINWKNTPYWLVISGCAVLSLRYSRGVKLTTSERGNIERLHRDIHGAAATVPGLIPTKQHAFVVYHPGWAWYQRAFQNSNLRGILGYWYRSPGAGEESIIPPALLYDDVEIIKDFTRRLSKGETLLEAWTEANQRGILGVQAAWAAMIRQGCKRDTLATLEQKGLTTSTQPFDYFDRYQDGVALVKAYREANYLDKLHTVGSTALRIQSKYDSLAAEELDALSPRPTSANLLIYNDGVGL